MDTLSADRRLALAGQCVRVLLTTRLTMVLGAAGLAVTASLAVTALVFSPDQWGVYLGANVLLAATYALIGVLIGPIFGRVSGVFMAFLLPFRDLGIAQSPMLRGEPADWAQWLPGHGGIRLMVDGALTPSFDELGALVPALG